MKSKTKKMSETKEVSLYCSMLVFGWLAIFEIFNKI
jgi:hypothetical protein